ncbi:MAG: hypothetical protein HUU16_22080, partial [Candidatus Omnitrophica bacterium]|nr:hypothetical protein [Candidatus Omnitrophota bacterium]
PRARQRGPCLAPPGARHLRRILKHTNWNKTRAATILKISRPTLDRKIDKYQLKRE